MSDELLKRADFRSAMPGWPNVSEDTDLIRDLAARVRELEAERDALRALLREASYFVPSGLFHDRIDAALAGGKHD